jgi:DNA-binding LytR/AlgR family response regulator
MSLSCYIVDDEYHAIEILTDFINKTPGLELVGASIDPLAALEGIADLTPALTFLDIDMPEINGLDFAELVIQQTTIVFTTAYREYGPEAFEKEVADYLLKPIAYERFLKCIQKIRKNIIDKSHLAIPISSSFFVKTGIKGKLIRVNIPEILYISSALNYIEIHFKEQKVMTYLTMGEVVEKLPSEQFSRIHNSYIVNHTFIQSLEYGQVRLEGQTTLPVGRVFRKEFQRKMSGSFLFSKRDQP